MESLNSNLQEKELHQLQQMQDKAKESCMASFRLLHSHLKIQEVQSNTVHELKVDSFVMENTCSGKENVLSKEDLKGTRIEHGFKRAFMLLFGQDADTFTKCSGTKSDKHDTSSSLGNYITHVVDANIKLVNNQVPFAEVQLSAKHNVLATKLHHTKQSEPIYDTYLLKKVDSNTTPDSTNMSHRGGEIDQDAEQYQVKSPLLNAEFFKMKDMVEKEVYNELSNRFLQLEKHCISLEISIQQKEESFQSNKPCKNQDSPEFCEFFEINELKAQLQAKNSTINNLKKQIKNVHEKSNEAKVKHDIDILETINLN
ncbi:hypothetical protein Tco_1217568 [Tanacetum coccineum]